MSFNFTRTCCYIEMRFVSGEWVMLHYTYYQYYTEYYQYWVLSCKHYILHYTVLCLCLCVVCVACLLHYTLWYIHINCHVVTVFVPHVLQSSWREREWVSAVENLGGLTYCTLASLCWSRVKIRIGQTCFWRRAVGVMLIVSKINYFSFAWFYTFNLSFVLVHKNWKFEFRRL